SGIDRLLWMCSERDGGGRAAGHARAATGAAVGQDLGDWYGTRRCEADGGCATGVPATQAHHAVRGQAGITDQRTQGPWRLVERCEQIDAAGGRAVAAEAALAA